MRFRFRFILLALSLPWIAQAFNGADLRWKTIETDHFVIHYHQNLTFTASKTAAVAEDIFQAVTGLYDFIPKKKTHVVLRDDEDTSNGFASYNLDFITLWATPSQHRLRGKEDWIRAVLAHEFAHVVSLQASSRSGLAIEGLRFGGIANGDTRQNFDLGASVLIPTHPYSRWWAEGTAQLNTLEIGYDPWDTSRDMLLRSTVLENNLLTFDEMRNIGVREHFGPELVYNQGFSFLLWLKETFGPNVNLDIARSSARSMSPQFDHAVEKATGIPAKTLYERWKKHLEAKYANAVASIRGQEIEGEKIETVDAKKRARMPAKERPYEDGVDLAYPRFSPDGRWFSYVQRNQVVLKRLRAPYDLDKDETLRPWTLKTDGRFYAWSPDSRKLVVSKRRSNVLGGYPTFDLYTLDLTRSTEHREEYEAKIRSGAHAAWHPRSDPGFLHPLRITRKLRATHPAWSPDGTWIAFSSNQDGHRSLMVVRPDGKEPTVWVPAAGDSEAYDPAWSPDGSTVAYTYFNHRKSDVWLYDVARQTRRPLMLDAFEDREPTFTSDGASIYWSSDRSGIFQLYRMDLSRPSFAKPVTQVPTGAFMPYATLDAPEILYARFSSFGFRAYRLDPKDGGPSEPIAPVTPEEVNAQIKAEEFPEAPLVKARRDLPSPRPVRMFPSFVFENSDIKRGFAFDLSDRLERHELILSALFGREQDYQAAYFNRTLVPTLFASYTAFIRDSTFDTFNDQDGMDDDPKTILRDRIQFIRAGLTQDFRTRDFLDGSHQLTLNYERRAVDRRLGHPILVGDAPLIDFRLIDNDSVHFEWNYTHASARRDRDADVHPRNQTEIRLAYAWIHTGLYSRDTTIPSPDREYFHHEASFLLARSFSLSKVSSLRWHSLWFRFNGGFKSRDVNINDEFYLGGRLNFRAFGQITPNTLLYGYEDFSVSGETLLLLQTGYTFPIRRAIDRRWWILYLDGVYGSVFHEIGNAWDYGSYKNAQNGAILLQSVGMEIRLKAFLFNDYNRWNTSLKVAHGLQDNAAHGFSDDDSPVRVYLGIGTEF